MSKLDTAVWALWRQRAEYEKKQARKTDSDLAAEVSDLVGYEIGRGTVNHWFRGRRDPSVREFMALCTSLGADPGQILLNVRLTYKQLPAGSTATPILQERAPTPQYLKKSAKRLKARKPVVKPRQRIKT